MGGWNLRLGHVTIWCWMQLPAETEPRVPSSTSKDEWLLALRRDHVRVAAKRNCLTAQSISGVP